MILFKAIFGLLLLRLAYAQDEVYARGKLFLSNSDGLKERSFMHDGLQRYFLEKKPDDLPNGSSAVIWLHAGTQSMRKTLKKFRKDTRRWLDLAEDNGFLLIVPNGTRERFLKFLGFDTKGDKQIWNDLREDFIPDADGADDVGFIEELVKWAIRERNIDSSRVYIAGSSNGGFMTQRMLIERPNLFAAGASFIANLPEADIDLPATPTPIFLMMGTEDPINPYEGGFVGKKEKKNGGQVRSAAATRDYYISAMGANMSAVVLDQVPDTSDDGCVIKSEFYPAADVDGEPVIFYTMEGGGHFIPYTSKDVLRSVVEIFVGGVCQDANGVDLAWAFMSQYPA